MEKRFKQGAWNLLCLQTGMCLPSARSRESVCKSHELLFTKKHLASACAVHRYPVTLSAPLAGVLHKGWAFLSGS